MLKRVILGGLFVIFLVVTQTIDAQILEDVATTKMVSDIYPGSGESYPTWYTVYKNKLYFVAEGDNGFGNELWAYDGINNPYMVWDIYPGLFGSNPTGLTVYNNKLYFSAFDGVNGEELWVFDGSSASIAADINPGPNSSGPEYLAVYNGALYFSAQGSSAQGIELWKYTPAGGATLVQDINPGVGGSNPSDLVVFNDKLYFRAYEPINGTELHEYNGSVPTTIYDIHYGTSSSDPKSMTVFNGAIYFNADAGGPAGNEVWKFDGSGVPWRASDINPNSGNSYPEFFAVYDGKLYFSASDGTHGAELWSTDGNTFNLVADINPGPSSSEPSQFVEFLGKMYFSTTDGSYGWEMWVYDGSGLPSRVTDIISGSGSSYPDELTVFNQRLYFRAEDGVHGRELWVYEYPIYQEMFYSQSTYDGWVLETAENTNKGGLINTSNLTCYIGDDALDRQYRTILHFNTSRIPDNAVVTQSSLQFKRHSIIGVNPLLTHGKIWSDIKEGFYSSNPGLVQSDFAAGSSMNFAGLFSYVPSGLAYPIYRASLKSDALQFVNLAGITQFRLRFAVDDDDDNIADYWKIFCGDMPVPFNRPVLRVWYVVP